MIRMRLYPLKCLRHAPGAEHGVVAKHAVTLEWKGLAQAQADRGILAEAQCIAVQRELSLQRESLAGIRVIRIKRE